MTSGHLNGGCWPCTRLYVWQQWSAFISDKPFTFTDHTHIKGDFKKNGEGAETQIKE